MAYNTIEELRQIANHQGSPLWKPILDNEIELSECSEKDVFARLEARYEVMEQSAGRALEKGLTTAGGLIEGISCTQYAYSKKDHSICGSFLNRLMARALSGSEVNAAMGKICACPTAGACGILPAVIISLEEKYQLERRTVLEGILTASGIGAIITQNATVSGAEGGCQAECGVAAAMAAAAATQMSGGTNDMAVNACCFALMNAMGLICDPVAGLVQVPCAQRNASQAVNAVLSADLALAGMVSIIPADEVIDAMFKVGRMLPMQLKETSQGGIAATPTGKEIKNHIFQKQRGEK